MDLAKSPIISQTYVSSFSIISFHNDVIGEPTSHMGALLVLHW